MSALPYLGSLACIAELRGLQDHEKVFEALEKMKNANQVLQSLFGLVEAFHVDFCCCDKSACAGAFQIKNATFPVLNQLRKELGESRKVGAYRVSAIGSYCRSTQSQYCRAVQYCTKPDI
eukprot:3037039-Rhodomonas_salina.3